MSNAHYFSPSDIALPEYESIHDALKSFFVDATPDRITVEEYGGRTSRFDFLNRRILLSMSHKNNAFLTVAHESCHLALAAYTNGASTCNGFRFLDEGLAKIFEARIDNGGAAYERRALRVAAEHHEKGLVSFEQIENWRKYFGDPDVDSNVNWWAYEVGASFISFVIATFGEDALMACFKVIGEQQNLDVALCAALHKDKVCIEGEWLAYLERPTDEMPIPQVLRLLPKNGASEVPVELVELEVEFDQPMGNNIALLTKPSEGINYRDAHWKDKRVLIVPVRLLPEHDYQISLGSQQHQCMFVSAEGLPLPIVRWNFRTAAKSR